MLLPWVHGTRLEAVNKELRLSQIDFDTAVSKATRQAELDVTRADRNVMRADRKAEKLTQELQAAQKALARLEAFVRKPEVRALYERFESARTREKSREDYSR